MQSLIFVFIYNCNIFTQIPSFSLQSDFFLFNFLFAIGSKFMRIKLFLYKLAEFYFSGFSISILVICIILYDKIYKEMKICPENKVNQIIIYEIGNFDIYMII